MIQLAIILTISLAVAHYFSDRLLRSSEEIRKHIISFTAGIAIVYVFMNLFPEFYKSADLFSPFLFTSVFIGFALFYLIDKEIYQKIKHQQIPKNIELAHGYGLTIYYFVVGSALVNLLNSNIKNGILFFIPVFIYAALSTMAAHGIHGMHSPPYKVLTPLHFVQSMSVIAGTLFALFFNIPQPILLYLTGLVVGILTYIVIRDMLPKGKKGEPLFFIAGAGTYLILIIFLWFI